jgi:hypothetical protein
MTKLFPLNGFFFWGDLILLEREREREREGGDPGKKYVEEMWWKRRVFVNKMFFLHRMCIPNTNESALIYIVLPAWLVIHRRFCIFLSFLF